MRPATTQGEVLSSAISPDAESAIEARISGISFALFVIGGLVGLLNMVSMQVPFGWGFEMVTLASNLAKHGTYANPFSVLDTGTTAAYTPAYPLFLSVLMRAFRNPDLVALAATIANILVNAIAAACLPRVAWVLFRNVRSGIIASVFWVASVQLMPDWDASYTAAALILFCSFTAATVGRRRYQLPAVWAGLMAGALFLLNPSSMIVFLTWMAYLLLFRRASLKQAGAYASIVIVLFAVVAFAWGFRNYRQLGKFVVRTNLGMTLYASNNDCASPSLFEEESENCHEAYHPNTSLQEAQTLGKLGEIAYDRQRTADAKAWALGHPRRFLVLTAARFRDFWFPAIAGHPYKVVTIWFATLLSIPGLVLMVRRRLHVTVFLIAVFVLYPVMYYVVVSDVRYRYPILWLTFLPAGFLCDVLLKRAQVGWFAYADPGQAT